MSQSTSRIGGKRHREEGEVTTVIDFNASLNADIKRQRADDFHELLKDWQRPIPTINESSDSICFMQIDIDYYTGQPHRDFVDSKTAGCPEVPILRMYGVTKEGYSVMAHIHGFLPYFYCQAPSGFKDASALRTRFNDKLKTGNTDCVLSVNIERKESLMHYTGQGLSDFFKVTVVKPQMVATCRGFIDRGMEVSGYTIPEPSYETSLPFALRYMVDRDISGGSWVELPAAKYKIRPAHSKTSHCQIELDLGYEDVIAHSTEGEYSVLAPLRTLSIDIECVKEVGQGFPDAEEDPIIQIGAVLTEHGSAESVCRTIFTLHSCAAIAGAHVFSFDREDEMMAKFSEFLTRLDPDLITGYNVVNFDLPYILNRCRKLRQPQAMCLGRLKDVQSKIKDAVFSSKALGTRENKDINIEGRVQFDILTAIQRDYKLRSYTLNAVSAHFLNEQKEDVHYSMIGDLFRGDAETRKRVAVYCLKDATLPLRLMDKLLFMYNYVEMARVTGTPVSFLLTRGQQIKVISQLFRKCKTLNYVVPTIKQQPSDDKYEGATVLEPKKGFYAEPIATLDFASLYPSIMMAHNLCYCTLIPKHMVGRMDQSQYTKTPTGDCFVNSSLRKGVLPLILDELLAARKRAKKEMAAAEDHLTKMVLNGRQLALKISANSVYGFTGATVGQLACLEISSSVTGFGRQMIDHTKQLVESKYTVANGYAHDAEVIYGDTDSVMVKFGTDDIAESMRLGLLAAQEITETFQKPIKLEFEKVYCPFLLMNKKRYAALLWTDPKKHDKMDCKGIETVRRDNCALVQQLVDKVLSTILIDKDVQGAIDFTKKTISELLQNRVDLSLLVISKSLGKGASSEDYAAKQAHVELAERMRKRDPGTAPGVGDRVAYVIIKGTKGAAAYEKAEDPLFVLENNLAIDAHHYLEHQLKQPLLRIFEPIMKNPEQLLTGAHTRTVSVLTSTSSALSKFVKKSLTCLGCKAVIKQGALCDHCEKSKELPIIQTRLASVREKEKEYAQLWAQCQRCQGSLHLDVLCTSRDCPIFYRRAKVKKEIATVQESFDRLNLSW